MHRLSQLCNHLSPSPSSPHSAVFIHPYLLSSSPPRSLPAPSSDGPPSSSPAAPEVAASPSSDPQFKDPLASDVELLRRKMIAIIGQHESPDVARHVTTLIRLSSQYRTSEDIGDLQALQQHVHSTCFLESSAEGSGKPGAHAGLHGHSSLLHPQTLQITRAFHELLNLANL